MLLTVFTTLPVSVALAERCFSILKRIKTWSVVGCQKKDYKFGHYSCTQKEDINVVTVIDSLSKVKNRKLNFMLLI